MDCLRKYGQPVWTNCAQPAWTNCASPCIRNTWGFATSGKVQAILAAVGVATIISLIPKGQWALDNLFGQAANATGGVVRSTTTSLLDNTYKLAEDWTRVTGEFLSRFGGPDGHIANVIEFLNPQGANYVDITNVLATRAIVLGAVGGSAYGIYKMVMEEEPKEESPVSPNMTPEQQNEIAKDVKATQSKIK